MGLSEINHWGITVFAILGQAMFISVYQEKLELQIESGGLRLLAVFLASELLMLPVSYLLGMIFFEEGVYPRSSILQLIFYLFHFLPVAGILDLFAK